MCNFFIGIHSYHIFSAYHRRSYCTVRMDRWLLRPLPKLLMPRTRSRHTEKNTRKGKRSMCIALLHRHVHLSGHVCIYNMFGSLYIESLFSNADIIISKPIITQTRKIELKNLTAHLIIREFKNAESSRKPNLLQVAVQVRPHKKSNMMSSKAKKKKKTATIQKRS